MAMTTREKAEQMRGADPYLPSTDIARACGVSRGRIHQILGYRTRALGQRGPAMVTLICEECGQLFRRELPQHEHRMKIGQRHSWCGKTCQGRWLGKHHGQNRKVRCE